MNTAKFESVSGYSGVAVGVAPMRRNASAVCFRLNQTVRENGV